MLQKNEAVVSTRVGKLYVVLVVNGLHVTRLCRSFRNDAAVAIFHMSYKAAATAPPKSEQLPAMLSNTISR